MATFHAVPIALKLKKRQVFESKVKKNIGLRAFEPPKSKEGEEPEGAVLKIWFEVLGKNEKCKLYIPRLKRLLEEMIVNMKNGVKKPKREPFATISHNDLWVNNTMQIFKRNKMVKNKFVDFQMYSYDSPAPDLFYFIWSSIQLPVVETKFNDLLKYYHDNFLEVLQELGCDTNPFSCAYFEKELKESAVDILIKCLFMFRFIFAKKGSYALDLTADITQAPIPIDFIESTEERAALMVQYFGRRGWV